MIFAKQTRHLIGPTEDIDVAVARRFLDRPVKFLVATHGHSLLNIEVDKFPHELRRAARAGVNDIENTRNDFYRRLSISGEISKPWADWKTEYFNFFRRDPAIVNDGRALFVGDEKVIGR